MKYGKWIGGIMGFMAMGPLGALAGFAIGSLFDKASDAQSVQDGGYSPEDVYMGQRNSFLFSMLVMSSYIIRADGRIMHSEMEYVRQFLRANFGESAVEEGQRILLNLFEQRKQMVAAAAEQLYRAVSAAGHDADDDSVVATTLTREQAW